MSLIPISNFRMNGHYQMTSFQPYSIQSPHRISQKGLLHPILLYSTPVTLYHSTSQGFEFSPFRCLPQPLRIEVLFTMKVALNAR
jgi:hypothetical protein